MARSGASGAEAGGGPVGSASGTGAKGGCHVAEHGLVGAAEDGGAGLEGLQAGCGSDEVAHGGLPRCGLQFGIADAHGGARRQDLRAVNAHAHVHADASRASGSRDDAACLEYDDVVTGARRLNESPRGEVREGHAGKA
jgi:hypothetical protein